MCNSNDPQLPVFEIDTPIIGPEPMFKASGRR
jgi:glycyl-tRNA synthetase (class II)